MGRKGGATTRDRHGKEFYEAIGSLGGSKVMAERGQEFYKEIGRKGGKRVQELVKKAIQIEAAEKNDATR